MYSKSLTIIFCLFASEIIAKPASHDNKLGQNFFGLESFFKKDDSPKGFSQPETEKLNQKAGVSVKKADSQYQALNGIYLLLSEATFVSLHPSSGNAMFVVLGHPSIATASDQF